MKVLLDNGRECWIDFDEAEAYKSFLEKRKEEWAQHPMNIAFWQSLLRRAGIDPIEGGGTAIMERNLTLLAIKLRLEATKKSNKE